MLAWNIQGRPLPVRNRVEYNVIIVFVVELWVMAVWDEGKQVEDQVG